MCHCMCVYMLHVLFTYTISPLFVVFCVFVIVCKYLYVCHITCCLCTVVDERLLVSVVIAGKLPKSKSPRKRTSSIISSE